MLFELLFFFKTACRFLKDLFIILNLYLLVCQHFYKFQISLQNCWREFYSVWELPILMSNLKMPSLNSSLLYYSRLRLQMRPYVARYVCSIKYCLSLLCKFEAKRLCTASYITNYNMVWSHKEGHMLTFYWHFYQMYPITKTKL